MNILKRRLKRGSRIIWLILIIEWLDELVFGAWGASIPLIRTELGLSYDQIGFLLTLPPLLASWGIEPIISLYGDSPRRRMIILVSGIGFAFACMGMGISTTFVLILGAQILFNPSSGGFVGLAQATLMDLEPERHEQNMARWTLAGSLGVVMGSLVIAALIPLGISWRVFFLVMGALAFGVVFLLWRTPFPVLPYDNETDELPFFMRARAALGLLRDVEVIRWLTLLQFSDLMLDVLFSYLTLYYVDVVGVSIEQAAFAVTVWTTVGLVGDAFLLPLLERVNGVAWLRLSVALQTVVYTLMLVVPSFPLKVMLGGINGFLNAGWYSVLQGNLYSALPERSASIMLLDNIFSIGRTVTPLLIGLSATRFGLGPTMVFPLIACAALWMGLPRPATFWRVPSLAE